MIPHPEQNSAWSPRQLSTGS